MTSQSSKSANKNPVNIQLILGLAAILIIWIIIAVVGKAQKQDPTLTAAPPTVSAPGHAPQTLLKPSQEKLDYLRNIAGSQSGVSAPK
jgi:hypothetical protein